MTDIFGNSDGLSGKSDHGYVGDDTYTTLSFSYYRVSCMILHALAVVVVGTY